MHSSAIRRRAIALIRTTPHRTHAIRLSAYPLIRLSAPYPLSDRYMLYQIYERLLSHFGAPHNWWPIFGDDAPFEMVLGAVLVQQTRWEAVEAAILRLSDAGL